MVQSLFAGLSRAEGANANAGDSKGSTSECSASAAAIARAERAGSESSGEICLFSSTEELLNGSEHQSAPFYQQQQQPHEDCTINGTSSDSSGDHSGSIAAVSRRQPRNTIATDCSASPASIKNGDFSSGSGHNSTTCFNHFNFHQEDSAVADKSPHNTKEHYSRQFYQTSPLSSACCCWPLASWNLARCSWLHLKFKFQALSKPSLNKMGLKRYYSLMLCLSLIIVSCLVASFVISRGVGGDLEAEDSGSSHGGANLVAMKLSSSTKPPAVGERLELRNIDLVDLIECGKTFAYTKYRLQVRVPTSSPVYRQQPAFLHSASAGSNLDPVLQEPAAEEGERQRATAPDGLEASTKRGLHQHHPEHHRFVLTSLQDSTEAETALQSATDDQSNLLEVAASEQRGNTGLWPPNSLHRGPPVAMNPLILDIKPAEQKQTPASGGGALDGPALLAFVVGSSSSGGDTDPIDTPPPSQSSAAAAVPEGEQQGQIAEASDPDVLLEPDDELDRFGPIEDATFSMGLSENAARKDKAAAAVVNKTLIDCFMVDTERRYGQKVALEDAYRQVASTRKVSFKKMMATVTECRLLTWASLSQLVRGSDQLQAPAQSTPAALLPLDNVIGAASTPNVDLHEDFVRVNRDKQGEREYQQEQEQQLLPQSFVRALLSSWLSPTSARVPSVEHGAPTSSAQEIEPQAAATGGAEALISEESRQQLSQLPQLRPQQAATITVQPMASGPDNLDRRRQGSYLNMGLSMISGIIPNTLWCGQGDRAANYSELGAEYLVDSCCRAHDHCPIRLKPFSTDYGLANWSVSTRSHCDCDLDFGQCLTAVNSTLSNVIKVLYFRFVGLQCIDVENRRQLGGSSSAVAARTTVSAANP